MKRLINPNNPSAQEAPAKLREMALKDGLQLLQITWDKEGGYLEHAWGFEQWSVRPYRLGYGCDGTTDENIHFIAWKVCEIVGIDYPALYWEAYQENLLDFGEWDRVAQETEIPDLENLTLTMRGILHDLNEINCRSVRDLLEDILEGLGYNMAEWWNYREENKK